MEKPQEELIHQRCQLPVSLRKIIESSHYRDIGLFDTPEIDAAWAQNRRISKDLIQFAWAILLRCYVRNDTVSFLRLSNPLGPFDDGSPAAMPVLEEVEEDNAVILQYRLFDNLRLLGIHVEDLMRCTKYEMRDLQMNTAVRFLTLRSKGPLHGNKHNSLSAGFEEDTSLNNVRLFDLPVLTILRNITLLYQDHAGLFTQDMLLTASLAD